MKTVINWNKNKKNIYRYCSICGKVIRVELNLIKHGKDKGKWKTPDGPWYFGDLCEIIEGKEGGIEDEYWECKECGYDENYDEQWFWFDLLSQPLTKKEMDKIDRNLGLK